MSTSIDQALDHWADRLRLVRGRSEQTIRGYTGDVRRMTAGIDTVEGFTLEHVRSRLAEVMHLAPSTRARMVTSARLFAAYCAKHGWSDGGRMDRLMAPKVPVTVPEIFTQDDAVGLCDGLKARALPGHDDALSWALVELLYGCGLRIEEAVSMDLADIDPEAMKVRVVGKGDKGRVLPIGPNQLAPIVVWMMVRPAGGEALFVTSTGNRLGQRQARRLFERACTNTDTPALPPHALRHSCATHMIEGGADIRVVAEHLGHTSLDTTQRYLHVATQRLIDVFKSAHPREKAAA